MSSITTLLDANVLYPGSIWDILMQLAIEDLFRAKWSADIHQEWIEALLNHEPQRDRAALERTRLLIDTAIRDGYVIRLRQGAAMDTITIGDKLYVTLELASEQSHYDREFLRKLAKAKKLNAVQIGSEWLVHVDSIATYQHEKPQRGAHSAKKKER